MENDVFEDFLMDEKNTKKSNLDILNELFSGKGIETRTDLNIKEIFAVMQKKTIAKLLGWKELDNVLNNFMTLKISKDRKGRSEFVDAFKSENGQDKIINKKIGFPFLNGGGDQWK